METKHLSAKTTAIEKVKERFETWREVRKKRTKIPEELRQANENTLTSFLLLKNMKKTKPYLPIEFSFDFHDILENMDDIHTLFPLIRESKLKTSFLRHVINTTEKWPEIFVKCFYEHPMMTIIDKLLDSGHEKLTGKTINDILFTIENSAAFFCGFAKT